MLILPPGHGHAVLTRRRFSPRERWIVRTVLAASVALVVVVVISLLSVSSKPARGCLNVDVPGPIGAQEFRQCGTQARQFCASIDAASGLSSAARQEVATACRKTGLAAP